MAFWQWSKTAASNATADPAINYAEGMSPSALNDSGRAVMAALAQNRDDISGMILTGGGASAYTLTTNQGIASTPQDGQLLRMLPSVGNNAGATLQVDGGTAFQIQSPAGSPVSAGVLVALSPCTVMFKLSTNGWVLVDTYSGAALAGVVVPVGCMLPYAGAVAPSSNFALCFGQLLDRTAYATLFGLIGTNFNIGGGGETGSNFRIPDLRGRVVAGQDNMGGSAANRITTLGTDGGTIVGATIGSFGGSQNHVMSSGEMPTHNHGITEPNAGQGHQHTYTQNTNASSAAIGGVGFTGQTTANTGFATTGITINNAGSSNPMAILPPMLIGTYIIRII